VEVAFRLPESPGWSLARVVFGQPEGSSRPAIVAAPYPPDASAGTRGGGVAVRFEVNEQGLPRNKAIVHRWRFRPALLDGRPVPAAAEVTLALGDWQLPPEPAPRLPHAAPGERAFRP